MREILFRGKRIDNGEWVSSGNIITFNDEGEGKLFFIPGKNEKCVCTHDEQDNIVAFHTGAFYKVAPSTVGQFTGLNDCNGKRIFEGDVIKIKIADGSFHNAVISFRNGYFTNSLSTYVGGLVVIAQDCEVIGNIHDNPELMREDEGDCGNG